MYYNLETGPYQVRSTKRWLCKLDTKFKQIVLFYSTPFDDTHIGIHCPHELQNMKVEQMVLVEPFYIYAYGRDDYN